MKLSTMLHAALVVLLSAWVVSGAAAEAPATDLLIVEVSRADHEAAERLRELIGPEHEIVAAPEAHETAVALRILLASANRRAVVLDSAARRVHVLERDRSVRTRIIDGEPSAYLTAFVASELLALSRAPAPSPAPEVTNESGESSAVARVEGAISLELARPYTSGWLLRPSFGLSMWLGRPRSRYVLPLIGLTLAGPARVQRSIGSAERISLTRWETGVQLGIAIPSGRLRTLLFGSGRLATTRASFSGPEGTEQRTLGLGLGAGAALECGLTRWLSVRASFDVHAMLRRGAYTVQGESVVREQLGALSLGLGLLAHTL
jgi:hypothetical protein